jgi:anti-anti-sigma regulatory factor
VREWLERVPASSREVVLDLTNVQQIDHNSAIELRTLVRTMRADDRRLLLAGITPEQFVQLQSSGVGDELSADDVCPDAELAVARGLGLIADSR